MREVTVSKATRTKLKNIPSLSMRQITEEWNETVRQKQADPETVPRVWTVGRPWSGRRPLKKKIPAKRTTERLPPLLSFQLRIETINNDRVNALIYLLKIHNKY